MGGIYWLASYPKSGNTWFRIFLRNLLEDADAPANINDPSSVNIASDRAWIDGVLGFDSADLPPEKVEPLRPAVYRWALQKPEADYHKIHDAYTFTTEGEPLVSREATRGALYILRNPLDVAISAASHWRCSVDQVIEYMADNDYTLADRHSGLHSQVRQRLLSWSNHVTSWVDADGLAREIVRYEDMLAEPMATFTRATRFLGLPDDPARIRKAIRFSEFRELARQEAAQGFREHPQITDECFFRRGQSNVWRDTLSDAQVARIIHDHRIVMRRFNYLDDRNNPL